MQITDTSTVARWSDEGVLRLWYDPEEEAAIRDDQLLHLQADHDWADDVQEIIRSDIGSINDGDVLEEIFLYPYRRAPKEFKDALLEWPELRFIRERMRDAEQECILRPEGAKIFVWPHQYTAVIEALKSKVRCKDIELHASSVIISQSLISELRPRSGFTSFTRMLSTGSPNAVPAAFQDVVGLQTKKNSFLQGG